ncbi:MAG: hypothetical protein M3Q79_01060 [bacterium]|nr:hypothetical protein [bacterium]
MNYAICVSGAAAGNTVERSKEDAYAIGQAIAQSGHIITTGATVGLPFHAARGAHANGGKSIGFSPASSVREHVNKYRLPIGVYDFVCYTGMNYVGRDAFLVMSSDAVITLGGRFGSLHEFTTALESHTLCGVLLGTGGAADFIPELMQKLDAPDSAKVIFETDAQRLVQKIVEALDKEYKGLDTTAIANGWIRNGLTGHHNG